MKDADQQIIQILREIEALQAGGGDYIPNSAKDTDGTLAANSDGRIPSQKAVKTYVDAHSSHSGGVIGTLDFVGDGSVNSNTGVAMTVTKDGTGEFTVLFTVAQSDASYIAIPSAVETGAAIFASVDDSRTNTGFKIRTYRGSDQSARDPTAVQVAVLRLSQ